ncbi:hypothetical protein LIER_36646 [Lithospermum erythrorhizon]|uniref:Uncharacterized protein n=1 Tax=Lithospermum erythrorhizon TaxID=34254 RepID=A0AAV3PAJ4_LITER
MDKVPYASAVGKPLKIDPLNVHRVKLKSARVCVELNVDVLLFDSIGVNFENVLPMAPLEGFLLQVFNDVLPCYCTVCVHILAMEKKTLKTQTWKVVAVRAPSSKTLKGQSSNYEAESLEQ